MPKEKRFFNREITPLYIDSELKKRAKQMNISLSQVANRAIEKELGLVNGVTQDYIIGEIARVRAERQAFDMKCDNEMLILSKQLDDFANRDAVIERIRNDPYTRETLTILRAKKSSQLFDVRLEMLKQHFNFPITSVQLEEWVNGGVKV